MNPLTPVRNWTALLCSALCLLPMTLVRGQTNTGSTSTPITNQLVMMEGKVEVAPADTGAWSAARLNQALHPGDHVRTRERSRASVYLVNGMTEQMGELSELEVPPSPGVSFWKGLFKIFNRERGRGSDFKLPGGVTAAIRGTDFLVRVTEDGRSELVVLDGEVVLSNALAVVTLTNNQRGTVMNGGAPAKTVVVEAHNDLIQWFLYFPGVLNAAELELTDSEKQALTVSLQAYRAGDLLQAGANYPWQAEPLSDAGRAYRVALLLSVGKVDEAQKILATLPASLPAARALNTVIAAVKFQLIPSTTNAPSTASEWLAESYYRQSQYQNEEALEGALEAAYAAVRKAPNFGFGWERVAELEFSFGRTEKALSALQKSLVLSPRNAQAVSLKGFLEAAQNRIGAAIGQFDKAIELDSGLGNAWLGRGLCYIRWGRREEGLRDLLVAASVESQRSLLRSYLGKAFADAGDDRHALRELALAKELDRRDPTSWLYSALLKQQENRINEAITDLETSQELNDNRSLFRSRLLLDEDRAVRSANLAAIYGDAGMFDVSVREASRAVAGDYANYSAHLFLANSYSQLSDPNLVSLRYETATFSEYVVANLLAPVGATTLSQRVSQQEYSKLFEHDRVGLSSSTTYLSTGDWQQEGTQFGTFGNTAYALDEVYRSFNGQRPNNDLEQLVLSAQFKQQLTVQDSAYLQVIYDKFNSGDLRQLYNQSEANQQFRVTERQEPNFFAGYHHEWSPGMHTLFLGGHLNDTLISSDPNAQIRTFVVDTDNQIIDSFTVPFEVSYHSVFDAYTAELQQIWQSPRQSFVAGARFQTGSTETTSGQNLVPDPFFETYFTKEFHQAFKTDLERLSFYAYDTWQIWDPFSLSAGVTYDHLKFPKNIVSAPISPSQETKEQVSPKAGFIWAPWASTEIRGAYTRSLGGLFYDQSVRLEPTQVAGFNQAFRSLFPESLVGTVPGSEFETYHLGLDQKFATRTYLVLEGAILESSATLGIGVLDYPGGTFTQQPSLAREHLDFEEDSLSVALNQLVGDRWSFGARYRFSRSELTTRPQQVPEAVLPDTRNRALLHQLSLSAIFNHPSGFFSEAEALWWAQDNHGYSPALPGDDFWQFNLFAGYRFPRRRAEVSIGLANLTGEGYRLNPLSLYGELPRGRTFVANLKFNF